MEQTPKEMLKAYVDSQKFNSTTEIMDAMKEMFRDVLQQVMESELDAELGYEKNKRMSDSGVENKPRNYRNRYSKKTVRTQLGAVEVKVLRDRNGEYEPQIIGKYSRNKENHQYQTKAAYVVLGVTMDGTKDILGVWIGEHESSKFWLNVLNDLKSRGVLDVNLFCVDGLKGFVEAIGAVYPHSQVQRCIVHQIRSSTRFVSYKDIKPLMADLKKVYTAVTENEALENLMAFKEKWGKQYPSCVKSWEDNWDILSAFFAYPPEIRKIIYTTNIIEGLNRQFRQITKNKPSFTNDDSLRKMLYFYTNFSAGPNNFGYLGSGKQCPSIYQSSLVGG